MIRTAVGFLGLLALLPALRASDKPEKQTPAQQYQALVKEYETAYQEFREALKKAKTREDQQKVVQEKFPQPTKYAPRFLELAEKNPKDPVALDALVWVVQNVQTMKSEPDSPRGKAMKILLRDHVGSEKMASVCPALRRSVDEDSRNLLRAVLEKNKHRPAQAQACLALAQQTEERLDVAQLLKGQPRMAKEYENFLGKESVQELLKVGPDKLSKEVEAFYERVAKDFADVPDGRGGKLGDTAKKKLATLVGKPAPEIAAEDLDGKKFKLSDYRGKVVMLDFWGNW